jgi:MFS family permease
MSDEPGRQGLVTFGTVWFGQLISLIGSVLSEFALGVYVYQQTGSATQFAILNLFIFAPQIVVAPFAGTIADRYNRRLVMILANLGAGLAAALLAVLIASHALRPLLVYGVVVLFSVCSALLFPAYAASIPMLVAKRHLGRANGMVQLAMSVSRVVAPLSAAFLLATIHLQGIVLADFASYLFAIGSLLLVRIPQPSPTGVSRGWGGIVRDATSGLTYIAARRGLLGLLLFFTLLNITASFFQALYTPLVLSFTSTVQLGVVTSIGGVALVASSLAMSVWGGPRRHIHGVLGVGIVCGLAIVLMGVRASVVTIGVATFLFLGAVTVINVSNSAIWQGRVPAEMLGRVLSTVRMLAWSTVPLALIAAGPLADHVFRLLLLPGGPLADSVGQVFGTGPGRGIGLLLAVMGLFPIVAGIAGYLSSAVRNVEDEESAPAPGSVRTA